MKKTFLSQNLLATASILSVLLLSGCALMRPFYGDQWFRGNTHTHTSMSDGDTKPESVVEWYHNHNYNFLMITDHNQFIDPEDVKLPVDMRDDFMLIPGEEITGSRRIHTTAMNIRKEAAWKYDSKNKSEIIQYHVDEAVAAGGQAILNHPNFGYAVSADDILPVDNLYMFELFNGHPAVNNHGDHEHSSTEEIWDKLLTEGKKIFAVSSDDMHNMQKISADKANPGRGWVMVRASTLDADVITAAMLQGDFYASNGVFLKRCERGGKKYVVEVDASRTGDELDASISLRGKYVESGCNGYKIEFIGPNGNVLETIKGEKGSFRVTNQIAYVRAKVTFTRKHPRKEGFEEYYAWGQPVFTDARANMVVPERDGHK